MKNSSNRGLIAAAAALLIVAAAMVGSYPSLQDAAAKKYKNPFEDGSVLARMAADTTAGYYWETLAADEAASVETGGSREYEIDLLDRLIEYSERVVYRVGGLDYWIRAKGRPASATTSRPIEDAMSEDKAVRAELEAYYLCILALSVDANGMVTYGGSFGMDEDGARRSVEELNVEGLTPEEYTRYEGWTRQLAPQDLTAVFAVPREPPPVSKTGRTLHSAKYDSYRRAGVNLISCAGLLAAGALALLTGARRTGWFHSPVGRAAVPPAELPAAVLLCLPTEFKVYRDLMITTLEGDFKEGVEVFTGTGAAAAVLTAAANVLAWLVLLILAFTAMLGLMNMVRMGPRCYIKEKSLCVRWLGALRGKLAAAWGRLVGTDLGAPVLKALKRAVLINAALIALISVFWVGGIMIILPAYSLILYYCLKKYLRKVQEDYKRVLKTAEEMAGGNLDDDLEEGFGMFDSLGGNLRRIRTGFRVAVEEERRSQTMKSELITNVSHDLKTPLTAIISYVDLLGDASVTPERRAAYLATLEQKSQRLKTLIEDLFEISKANSGNALLEMTEVDLAQLLRQTRVELADQLERSGLDFRFALPEERVLLRLDSQKMFRVFENLLCNIVKYAAPGTRVYICMERRAGRVVTEMKNISARELCGSGEELTERFVRGDRSRNTEGSGLGLAIARSFVELQGGIFTVLTDGDLFKAALSFPDAEL